MGELFGETEFSGCLVGIEDSQDIFLETQSKKVSETLLLAETLEDILISWEGNLLAKFSNFLGYSIECFEEEVLELLSRIDKKGRERERTRGGW